MTLRRRLLIEWVLIALIGTLAVVSSLQWRSVTAFDGLFYDQLSALSRPEPDDKVLIVNIDEASLAAIGKWPWDREVHARLIEKLQSDQPRSILLDILLSEPSPGASDARLVNAVEAAGNVFLPVNFQSPGSDGRLYEPELPIESLRNAAKGKGHVNVSFDNDGIVRRINLCFDAGERQWPHVTELVMRRGDKPTPSFAKLRACGQDLLLPYARRDSFSEISYSDALNGNIPPELIRGRDIIIGASAAGMGDVYPGPFADGGVISGSEIMANMISALRRDNFIEPAAFTPSLIFSLLPMWLLMFGFLRWKPRTALLVSVALFVVIMAVSAGALFIKFWIPPGAALAGIILVYPLWGWRRLQAMSAFMQAELGDLQKEGDLVPLALHSDRGADLVGRQSAALAGAIDHLRDLRRFVSDSLEHLPDPMFVTDTAGTVTMANHRIEEYLGPDLKGTSLSALLDRIVAPAHRRNVDKYLQDRLPAEASTDANFVRFMSPEGSHFVMRSAPVFNDLDDPVGKIHYLADISELAQAESDREEALQLLSHDMRSPQSAIIALLPTIRDEEARQRIESHARRTIALAQDFVDVARMGESPFEGSDVLLADLAQDIADNLWPLAQERNVQIDVTDHSDSAFVLAEPDSLGRAITNILDNAVKFSPVGSRISLSLSREYRDGVAFIVMAVADEGPGIDSELLPRLFGRFASRAAPDARIQSSGLGLTYVRAVAERHGGRVWAENRPRGACFYLELPEAAEPVEDS